MRADQTRRLGPAFAVGGAREFFGPDAEDLVDEPSWRPAAPVPTLAEREARVRRTFASESPEALERRVAWLRAHFTEAGWPRD